MPQRRRTRQAQRTHDGSSEPPGPGPIPVGGLTVAELARRIRRSDAFTAEMLEDWRLRGIATESGGAWRLTADGFDRHGRAVLDAAMGDERAA